MTKYQILGETYDYIRNRVYFPSDDDDVRMIYSCVLKFYDDTIPNALKELERHNISSEYVAYDHNKVEIVEREERGHSYSVMVWVYKYREVENYTDEYDFINYLDAIIYNLEKVCLYISLICSEYEMYNYAYRGRDDQLDIDRLICLVRATQKYWFRANIIWNDHIKPISKVKSARSSIPN